MIKKLDLFTLNNTYSGRKVSFKISIKLNRTERKLQELSYIIDKIYYREPDFKKQFKEGSLIISLKDKYSREIEIFKDSVYFNQQFEHPIPIYHFDETLQAIINNYRR